MRPANPTPQRVGSTLKGRNSIVPHFFELCALVLLIVFQIGVVDGSSESDLWLLNALSSAALAVVLVAGAYRMARLDSRNLLNILFWFRMSVGTFFGFGTFALYIMNDVTLLSVRDLYAFNNQQVAKLNLICTSSAFCVLALARVAILLGRNPRRLAVRPPSVRGEMLAIGVFFFLMAAFVDLFFRIPHSLGETQVAPSGVMNAFSKVGPVGFFMMTVAAFQSSKRLLLVIVVVVLLIEVGLSFLLFQKQSIFFYAIMFGSAWLWVRITLFRVVTVSLVIAAMLPFSYDIVGSARTIALQKHGVMDGLGAAERMRILSQHLSGAAPAGELSERQGYLSRLSYANAATFVIQQYDIGLPGDNLVNAIYVFIPRIVWPAKPVMSGTGNEVYFLLKQSDSASFGVGWFAHAYWNFGWPGVLAVMSLIGVAFGFCADYSWRVLASSDWLRFPVVLLLARMGMRTDGDLLTDVIGQAPIILAVAIALRILDAYITSNKSTTRRRRA